MCSSSILAFPRQRLLCSLHAAAAAAPLCSCRLTHAHPCAAAAVLRCQDGLPERLVRRRLRLLAAKAQPFHASRMRVWALALIPQLPLIPLPLPNVTLYYTAWRVASNFSAGKGRQHHTALAGLLQVNC